MGLLGKIFGNKKIIDSAISGIDKMFYTNEEKADYHLSFLKAYEPFKLAQRLIALIVIPTYLFVLLVAVGLMIYGSISETELIIKTSKEVISLINENLGWAVIAIIGFYFMGGVVDSYKRKK